MRNHGLHSLSSPTVRAKRREPLTGARLIIVVVAVGFALFLLWAMLAQVDEVTAGQGKVIPSSKVQLIQAAEPATVRELLVRSGQRVQPRPVAGAARRYAVASELGQIEAETERCRARSARLAARRHWAPASSRAAATKRR